MGLQESKTVHRRPCEADSPLTLSSFWLQAELLLKVRGESASHGILPGL